MRVKSIRLRYFRSFVDSGDIDLGTLNVLIGANNSGKSSVLRGLHQLQQGQTDIYGDVRVGNKTSQITMQLGEVGGASGWPSSAYGGACSYSVDINSSDRRTGNWQAVAILATGATVGQGDLRLPNSEPHHFVVPYLSKRKATAYSEDVREQFVTG